MPRRVTGPRARFARNRLARIRLQNPSALGGVNPQAITRPQARRIRRVATREHLLHAPRTGVRPAASGKPQPFNPLAPLSGKSFNQEANAQANLEFGDAERANRQQTGAATQTRANTGQYYQDFLAQLSASAERVKANNAAVQGQIQGAADTGYAQDTAQAQAQAAQAAADAAARGQRAPAADDTGTRAAAANRTQMSNAAATAGTVGAADYALFQNNAAAAPLARAQALQNQDAKIAALGADKQALARKRGDFLVSARQKAREDERTYALARKEFGLKAKDVASQISSRRAQTAADKQKVNAQKIVASMYAGASIAKAKAQIRVAKLQLQKGKIDQHQYKRIVSIYKGLPQHPSHFTYNTSGGGAGGGAGTGQPIPVNRGGSGGAGTGKNGIWSRQEINKINKAISGMRAANIRPDQRNSVIDHMVNNKRDAITGTQAKAAWARYYHEKTGRWPGETAKRHAPSHTRVGGRPAGR